MAVIVNLIIILFALYQVHADERSHGQERQDSGLTHELSSGYSKGQASLWPKNAAKPNHVSQRRRAFTSRRSEIEPLTEIKARQSGEKAWGGWQNIRYLFTLCVKMGILMKYSADIKPVATRTRSRFYRALNAISM